MRDEPDTTVADPDRFPGYRLLAEVGSHLGTLRFKALQKRLGRFVVMHVLPAESARKALSAAAFERQLNVCSTLRHENVVGAIDAGEHDGSRYFVTEHIDGSSLFDVLAKEPPFAVRRALTVALDVARALSHLEGLKLVHREVSPRTIALTEAGHARLVDFRRAKFLSPDTEETWHDTTLNAAFYTSPEASRGERGTDIRADVYSLGCVLYHMLCGRPPFWGRNAAVILDWHRHKKPRDPRWLRADIPRHVVTVIDRCVRKARDTRYPGAAPLCADLEAVIAERAPAANFPDGQAWERPYVR